MSKKAPSKKPAKKNNAKAALAKGAKAIQEAKAAAKAKPAKKTPPAPTSSESPGALSVIAPVKISTRPIDEILRDRVTLAHDFSSLELFSDTPIEEFLPVYDHFVQLGQKYQFTLGDLYNEGFRLYGDTFAQSMAASGRPISTLKKWGSIAANVPANLRNLHPKLEWSHCAEVAKLPDAKDKKEVLTEAAKEAKGGKVPSVKEIRARVEKIKPKQKRGVKKPTPAKKDAKEKRAMTLDERDALIELEEAAARLESLINGASFIVEIESDATMTLREKIGAAARLLAKLDS